MNDVLSFVKDLTDVSLCIFLQISVAEVDMEEKGAIEGVVAEVAIEEEAMGVKWEEGKQSLYPCLVVQCRLEIRASEVNKSVCLLGVFGSTVG